MIGQLLCDSSGNGVKKETGWWWWWGGRGGGGESRQLLSGEHCYTSLLYRPVEASGGGRYVCVCVCVCVCVVVFVCVCLEEVEEGWGGGGLQCVIYPNRLGSGGLRGGN